MSAIERISQPATATHHLSVASMTATQIAEMFGRSVDAVSMDIASLQNNVCDAYDQIKYIDGEYVLGPIAVMALILGDQYGGDRARYRIAEYTILNATNRSLPKH